MSELAERIHDKMHTDWRRIIELRGKKFTFDSLPAPHAEQREGE